MKRHTLHIAAITLSYLLTFHPAQAEESDSLQWNFTDLFQGTRDNPSLPTSLEGWKDHLEFFGRNIPQEEVFLHMANAVYMKIYRMH